MPTIVYQNFGCLWLSVLLFSAELNLFCKASLILICYLAGNGAIQTTTLLLLFHGPLPTIFTALFWRVANFLRNALYFELQVIIPYWIWQWNKVSYKLHKTDVFKDKELSKIRPLKYFGMLAEGRFETNGDEIRDKSVLWPRLFGCINIKFDFDELRVSLLAIIHLFSEVISVVIFLWRWFIFLSSTIKQVSSANSLGVQETLVQISLI